MMRRTWRRTAPESRAQGQDLPECDQKMRSPCVPKQSCYTEILGEGGILC